MSFTKAAPPPILKSWTANVRSSPPNSLSPKPAALNTRAWYSSTAPSVAAGRSSAQIVRRQRLKFFRCRQNELETDAKATGFALIAQEANQSLLQLRSARQSAGLPIQCRSIPSERFIICLFPHAELRPYFLLKEFDITGGDCLPGKVFLLGGLAAPHQFRSKVVL